MADEYRGDATATLICSIPRAASLIQRVRPSRSRGLRTTIDCSLTSYVMITPAASGACRLDTVTKGKTVTLIQKSFCVSEKDRQYAEVVYPWYRTQSAKESSCRGGTVRYVRDDIAATGLFVRRSTAARCANERWATVSKRANVVRRCLDRGLITSAPQARL